MTNNYLKSAVEAIYGKDDDFILLGLTGRTGSGCSTVASILQADKAQIKHSLFSGNDPANNEDRKQKIIRNHFEQTWAPFSLIQVRSVLTLALVDLGVGKVMDFIKENNIITDKKSQKDLKGHFESIAKVKKNKKNESNISCEQFYTKELPALSDKIKITLGENAFVKLYQIIGTNIRTSGSPIDNSLKEGEFFKLAKMINSIVKDIRNENKIAGKNTFIVIDAIRSPLEAIFFQERYAGFSLVAVSCNDSERKMRLRKQKYSEDDIKSLDMQEYQDRNMKKESSYSIQDIQGCLQRADLYISNPDEPHAVSGFKSLSNQVLTFISLMRRPGLVTPTAIERCMQIAYTAKLNSGCISRQVGAVVTDKNYSIKSIGWNDTPHGQVPCNLRNRFDLVAGIDQAAYSTFEKNDGEYVPFFKKRSEVFLPIKNEDGRNISYCFKSEYNTLKNADNQVHTRSLHAEENAFLQISKYGGIGLEGGNLFTTASPCDLCAKKAYQLGIKNIYYIDPYPGISMSHILEGGIRNPELVLFSGAIGRAFHRLYTPIVAYKDELNALVSSN